jgi:hypothetical protein
MKIPRRRPASGLVALPVAGLDDCMTNGCNVWLSFIHDLRIALGARS